MAVNLQTLQQQITTLKLLWRANTTSNSNHSPEQAKNRTGYVPGPNQPTLQQREKISSDAEANAIHVLRSGVPPATAAAVGAPAAPAAGTPPAAFDWRNVSGHNYVTPIEDQGGCGSCVAFGCIAAMETWVRITRRDPNFAVDLSEAQLWFCYGPKMGAGACPDGGWWPDNAYNAMQDGIVDAACFQYTSNPQACNLCANWMDRLTKTTGWQTLSTQSAMKAYIASNGPLTTCFTVYEDFYYHYTGGVYTYNAATSGNVVGGHCVCIVGYDDGQRCWIAKNSWGSGWGENGFFQMSYGSCGIDAGMWAINGIAVTTGLVPEWMVPSPISGPAGSWSRGPDIFTAADVDHDGRVEIVIANNNNGWTGLLKWNGSAMAPVWMVPSPIKGPAGSWSRGPDIFTAADVDHDGKVELVIANDSNGWTGVLKWNGSAMAPVWMIPSPIKGPAGSWSRGADIFTAADVDGDGEVEIVIANNANGWTGVLKWNGSAMAPVWMVPSPIAGPPGSWARGPDTFIAADVDGDGKAEIVVANNTDHWTGVLKWNGSALAPVWMIPSPINGPAGSWSRGADSFTAADVDHDGKVEIVVANNSNGWTGVLKWNGSALAPVWMVASPIVGPAGQWARGPDILTAGDVDGDGKAEIVIANNSDDWTGVLKWNGSALAPVWMIPSPITGPIGTWNRGPDSFTAADTNGDGCDQIVIANNSNGWTGVLMWNQGLG
jgi:C1A family cysteine protease